MTSQQPMNLPTLLFLGLLLVLGSLLLGVLLVPALLVVLGHHIHGGAVGGDLTRGLGDLVAVEAQREHRVGPVLHRFLRQRIPDYRRDQLGAAIYLFVRAVGIAPQAAPRAGIWTQRFDDIVRFEQYLSHNAVVVCKFFLNVSKEEQAKRFLERLDEPEKNWKFSAADVRERECWDDYMTAYEEMVRNTATPAARWFVVPADHKWFTRLVVAAAVVDTLEDLKLSYPKVDSQKRKELADARKLLEQGEI